MDWPISVIELLIDFFGKNQDFVLSFSYGRVGPQSKEGRIDQRKGKGCIRRVVTHIFLDSTSLAGKRTSSQTVAVDLRPLKKKIGIGLDFHMGKLINAMYEKLNPRNQLISGSLLDNFQLTIPPIAK